jgi:PTH2 family peptidyl-tRNA hydrolase
LVKGTRVPVKLALVVRTDLGMGRGKLAAQVAHAAVAAALATRGTDDHERWVAQGQPKVVLRVDDAAQLQAVIDAATAAGVPVEPIQDAGRTQVPPGTLTCCAVGPAGTAAVDALTGDLRLL